MSEFGEAMQRGAATGFRAATDSCRRARPALIAVSKETLRGTAFTVIPAALVAICIWYFAIRTPPEKIVHGETSPLSDYVSVSVDVNGHAFVDRTEMKHGELPPTLKKVHDENSDAKVLVRGDAATMHGNVLPVLTSLRSAAFSKIAFEINRDTATAWPKR